MGLQRKMGTGIKLRRSSHIRERTTQLWRRRGREDYAVLAEWGPRAGNRADGAGSLNHRLLLLFLRYGTLDWAQGEGRTVCVCGYSRGL